MTYSDISSIVPSDYCFILFLLIIQFYLLSVGQKKICLVI